MDADEVLHVAQVLVTVAPAPLAILNSTRASMVGKRTPSISTNASESGGG
jgi:hypothetical protein